MFRKSKRLTVSKYKGHEQQEIENKSDMVDYISNLPDCILHHVLSFMSTKEAAKTSVLSTRWKNLWAYVPDIDIDDELLCADVVDGRRRPDVTSFVNFVERGLRLHDASNMKKFCLSCRFFHDAYVIRSWISDAIMHKVQDLDLTLCAKDPCVIPRSMFDSTSLVSLKLKLDCPLQLPSHVSFPHLKTLQLSGVHFWHDDFTEKFFSGCPVLEELVLLGNCYKYPKNIAISIASLKSLTIRNISFAFVLVSELSNGCKINIDATNLKIFEYTGYLLDEIILNNITPSLHKSFIDILNLDGMLNVVTCRAINLLKQLQNVVSLRLSNRTLQCLSFADNKCFPVLPNLTHLTLAMEIGTHYTFKALMHMFSHCPVLRSICFSKGFNCFMDLGVHNSILLLIPTCISNSLKTVTLKNFHGYDSEICFLKHVLKNARVLERMDISWSETRWDLMRISMATEELKFFERSSTACVIKFS